MIHKAQFLLNSAQYHFALFGLRGVVRRALVEVPGLGRELSVPVPNSPNKVVLRLGTTDVAAFEHVFINREYGFTLSEEPSVIVDAGANIGMSSVYFSTRYPNATIIAIEPDPENFAILEKNAKLHPRITPINAALWHKNGVVFLEDGGAGGWGMRVSEASSLVAECVPSLTLDTLLVEHELQKVDLLKIDIEGAEYEVLQNAHNWIDRVMVMCVELHDRFRPGCSKIFEEATIEFAMKWQRGELSCAARNQTMVVGR